MQGSSSVGRARLTPEGLVSWGKQEMGRARRTFADIGRPRGR